MSSLDVGVVGAGIVGLSAAINIQKLIRRVKVTVLADSFGRDTSTPVTPCVFLPIPTCIRGISSNTACEWLTESWRHHYQMANSPEGKQSGQSFMSGHYLWSKPPDGPNKVVPTLVKDYHLLTEQEMEEHKFNHRYACKITTVVVDQIKYMQWLMKEFRQRGGHVVSDTAYSLQELYGQFDVVVNCVGNRGRETVQDPYLVPVKGYVVQVEHQCPKQFLITDDPITVIPHMYLTRCSEICQAINRAIYCLCLRYSNLLRENIVLSTSYVPDEMQRNMPGNKSCNLLFVSSLFKFTTGKHCFEYLNSHVVDVGHLLEADVYSQEKNLEMVELMLNKVKALVPSLMGSTVIESYVSRRSYRSPPLINIEMVGCGGPILPVVHNIGMGLEAVTLSWGMGAEAAHLVQDVLRLTKPFPHMCQPFNTLA